MREISPLLARAQKSKTILGKNFLLKVVLTYGETTYTYDKTRIKELAHTEQGWTQTATLLLDDTDKTLHGLDLEGYKAVISYGLITRSGAEYVATAPLWVVGQQRDSYRDRLECSLTLEGIFDRMSKHGALEAYTQESTDTNTVKDLLTAIAGSTLGAYSGYPAYTITFDSEDALIDTFIPADDFLINLNDTRFQKFKELMGYTTCVARVEDDGAIHIFAPKNGGFTWTALTSYSLNDYVQPTTSNKPDNNYVYKCTTAGTSHTTTEPTWPTTIGGTVTDGTVVWTVFGYDEEYSLAEGYHNFFNKRFRRRIVSPNVVVVSSHPSSGDNFTGFASDDSTSLTDMEEIETFYVRATSSEQCEDLATAYMSKLQMEAEKGAALIPFMNFAQEAYDYVNIDDSRAGDSRAGNTGYLTRNYQPGQASMSFGFGTLAVGAPPLGGYLFETGQGIDIGMLNAILEGFHSDILSLTEIIKKKADKSYVDRVIKNIRETALTAGMSRVVWKDDPSWDFGLYNQTAGPPINETLDLTAFTSGIAKIAILQLMIYIDAIGEGGVALFEVWKGDIFLPDAFPYIMCSYAQGDRTHGGTEATVLCGMDTSQRIKYYINVDGAGSQFDFVLSVLGYIE